MAGLRHLIGLGILILVATLPVRAQDLEQADAVLQELVLRTGVSGHEEAVRDWIHQRVSTLIRKRGWDRLAHLEVDPAGNLVLRLGSGAPRILFVAHMDEIGFEVEALEKDGTLVLRRRGGFYPEFYLGRVIQLQTPRGLRSVVLTAVDADGRLRAWTGYTSDRELVRAGFAPGQAGTIRKEYFRLGGPRRMGRSMDDRVGCAALLLALQALDPERLRGTVVFAWVVEEEVGLNGAEALADRMAVPVVAAVDTFVSGDSPLESDHFAVARLGAGAVLRAVDHSNLTPRAWVARVLEWARQQGVPLQFGVTGGGNDGAAFVPYGAVDIPVAWPLRYSHSPVDSTDLRDVVALARLVRLMAENM